ncbi:MAG: Zn-ribbon domain-containing OB-fold protein [Leucobacter sp.]
MTTQTEEIPVTALLGTRCDHCDRMFYPARAFCPTCWADDLPGQRLPEQGTIATWTVVRMGKKFPTPYALGYADFEGDVRVLGRIANWEEGVSLKPGIRIFTHAVEQEVDGVTRTVDHFFTFDHNDLEANLG